MLQNMSSDFKYFETLLAFLVLLLFNTKNYFFLEAVVRRCSVEKVLLEISQNSRENACGTASLLKKRLWHRCFPVKFVKFLRIPFFTEHLWATASSFGRGNISFNIISIFSRNLERKTYCVTGNSLNFRKYGSWQK